MAEFTFFFWVVKWFAEIDIEDISKFYVSV